MSLDGYILGTGAAAGSGLLLTGEGAGTVTGLLSVAAVFCSATGCLRRRRQLVHNSILRAILGSDAPPAAWARAIS